jgi:dynein heavy chain
MPGPDKYETQGAIALIRQHKDYGHWYNRSTWILKDIQNTMYLAAMNPTAGSFFINDRLQRHFWTVNVIFPETASLTTIYSAFMNKHFAKFKTAVNEQIPNIIKTTIAAQDAIQMSFRKTAQNFHYEFNVRHLTNVFQGLLQAKTEVVQDLEKIVKLWIHEMERIYGDRLVNAADL